MYLDPEAAQVLAERRESAKPVVSGRTPIECVNGEVRWWTFAGGRINVMLRYALEALGEGWQVIPDNFVVKVRGESLDQASFHRALGRLREIEFWEDEALWGRVAQALPNYRLSKFQPLMPPWIARARSWRATCWILPGRGGGCRAAQMRDWRGCRRASAKSTGGR